MPTAPKKNTAKLWNQYWQQVPVSQKKDLYALISEERSIRWERIETIVVNHFGGFTNLKILELGAGVGTYSALMARRGAKVTVSDYSSQALVKAKQLYQAHQLKAQFVKLNALSLLKKFENKFDVVVSVGLTEHFKDADRVKINQAHFKALKKNGLALIMVPNAWNLPYRVFKFIFEQTGRWEFGEEYPYTRDEFAKICQQLNIKEYGFFGESIFRSLRFINPILMSRKLYHLFGLKPKIEISQIKTEIGTPLDEYLSFSLGLWAIVNY